MPMLRHTILGAFLLATPASAEKNTKVKLANGVEMPVAAMGVWQYKPDEAEAAIKLALQVGFTHIDTANDYFNEVGVGKAIATVADRSSIFLTTKVPGCGAAGVGQSGTLPCKDAYAGTQKFLTDNLKLLNQEYVDLVLVHFPPSPPVATDAQKCEYVQQQWKAMEEFYKANNTRAIGVSSYCPSHFECLAKTSTVTPMVNQVEYHVGMGSDPGTVALKKYSADNNIVLQAWSPLGDGDNTLITGNMTTSIAKAHGKSSGATVALKWVVQSGVAVVTKANSEEYLAEDFDLFDWQLTDAEMLVLTTSTVPSGNHKKCLE
jgi:diketogulonate reductase-like aldo/keto reductase